MGITYIHMRTRAAYWFTLEMQIYIKASSSLSLDWKGDPHLLLSPLLPYFTCLMLWLDATLHFILPAFNRVLSQRWSLAHTTAVTTDFSPFLPVGSGITVGSFFRLCLSLYMALILSGLPTPHPPPPLLFHSSPQIASQSYKEKWLAN